MSRPVLSPVGLLVVRVLTTKLTLSCLPAVSDVDGDSGYAL